MRHGTIPHPHLGVQSPKMSIPHMHEAARHRPHIPQDAPRPPSKRQKGLAKIDQHIRPKTPQQPDQVQSAEPAPEVLHAGEVLHARIVRKQRLSPFTDQERQMRVGKALAQARNHRHHEHGIPDVGEADHENPLWSGKFDVRSSKRGIGWC